MLWIIESALLTQQSGYTILIQDVVLFKVNIWQLVAKESLRQDETCPVLFKRL